MTFGSILLLVLLATFLISCFDWTASLRERKMIEQGFERQLEQFAELIVPQSNWDDAVEKLDHHFDADFADSNFGEQLYTFSGFTHSFIVNGDDAPIYASKAGQRVATTVFEPFAQVSTALLRQIRRAEAARPPIKPSADRRMHVTKPIQATGLAKAEGQIFIVIATLIQPDLGLVVPKGPRAPVVLTAMPIDKAMLAPFAARYLVKDLTLDLGADPHFDKIRFRLQSPSGEDIAFLCWTSRRPGAMLYRDLKWPMLAALLLLGVVGALLIRRTRVIVEDLIQNEKQAHHLAYHDQLTTVPNRAKLFTQLPILISAIGDKYPLIAILCVDLDRFKEVNDTLGHHAGDDLLKTLAARLQEAVVPSEHFIIARLGGDEFVLASAVQDRAAAESLAARCLDRIIQPVECDYGRIDIGGSIGVALIAESDADPSAVLRRADMALYAAKAGGRGQVAFYEPEMDDAIATRRAIEESLRASLHGDAFHIKYQPQVGIDGDVRSLEALLRWTHPTMGEISPAVFIPLAEEAGLIMAVGDMVLRRVFAETADWTGLRVAINVSAIQMRTPGFAAHVMQLAAHAGIDASRYEIELTETALLSDGPATSENFDILRRLGFSIVLDDFGTGYSSLSLLHRFRFDRIKVDRTFVSDIAHNAEVAALVSAIVKLANSFRLGVIAEGVETEEQRDRLIAAGCTEFQGYLTGLPMLPEEIEERFHAAYPARLQA
jgi:diguanylate cyclase (GGDEF) domain